MSLPILPITEVIPSLRKALSIGSAVLTAPPGSGKTTIVPLELLNVPWLTGKKIIILQPRRVAARAACFRMSSLLNEQPGNTVGYHIRQDRKIGARTRIEVVTEGILTRRIQNDPELTGVGLIIFDEFHERSIHADLALALCLDLCQINEHLKILVMSATLDAEPISHLLGDVPIINGDGKCYEVKIEYQKTLQSSNIAHQVVSGITRVLNDQTGDILVFLPGIGDIVAVERILKSYDECENISIQALYGNLPQKSQDDILYPKQNDQRRIVLATSIAETSLTIDGISNVVDSGWSKRPYFNPANGLTSLKTIRVSKGSADQRTGRAGRLGPGYCLRLWDEATHYSLIPFHPPEIINSDLSSLVLEILLWGINEPGDLLWLDPPRVASYENGIALLSSLGAIDHKNGLTPLGRKLAHLPLHPRLAQLLVKSEQACNLHTGADICALLTERDIIDYRDEPSAELSLRLELLSKFKQNHSTSIQRQGLRIDLCKRVVNTSKLFKKPFRSISAQQNSFSVASLLLSAYPDRVAKRISLESGRYLLANGRVVRLKPSDPLIHSEYLVVANLDAGKKEGRIYLAEPIELMTIQNDHPTLIKTQKIVVWDEEKGKINATLRQSIGAINFHEKQLHNVDEERIADALVGTLNKNGLHLLDWNDKVVQLQTRIHFLAANQPNTAWPDISTSTLEKNLDWLVPYISGVRNSKQLHKLDLYQILLSQLDYPLQQKLQKDAPEFFIVPSGSKIKIKYIKPTPILAVRMQELYGLTETPTICNGCLTLLLHLLSPARRPIQVTSDLKGFWNNSYHEVKKELKGRYPKHFWPDDPASAQATKTTKRNKRKL
jgi:ATP-dependent RNA helicase HrpB